MSKSILMRALVRGLQVDAQCGEGGVVYLAIRTQEQHQRVLGRIAQGLTNALYRVADLLQFHQHQRGVRVVAVEMGAATADDFLPDGGDAHIREVWPVFDADGDAHYQAFLIHEGIQRGHDGRAVEQRGFLRGQKCRNDFHKPSLVGGRLLNPVEYAPPIDMALFVGRRVIVVPDSGPRKEP